MNLAIFIGLTLGIAIGLLIRLRKKTGQQQLGQRLLAYTRERKDYRMFVGMPLAKPTSWTEIAEVTPTTIVLDDKQVIKLSKVTAYFATYPSGTLVDYCAPGNLALPEWVSGIWPSNSPETDTLTTADLEAGQALVRVSYGPCKAKPGSRQHYSTTLTNVSDRPIQVMKFAGYRPTGKSFKLNTVTRRFYSAEEFKEWYGQAGDWIAPGQSVTDPNNYGSPPSLWAYYCEAEDGQKFVIGGMIE